MDGWMRNYMRGLAEPEEASDEDSHPGDSSGEDSEDRDTEMEDGYFSEPEWCNESIMEAEEALKKARRNKNAAHEATGVRYGDKIRAQKMMTAFLE